MVFRVDIHDCLLLYKSNFEFKKITVTKITISLRVLTRSLFAYGLFISERENMFRLSYFKNQDSKIESGKKKKLKI